MADYDYTNVETGGNYTDAQLEDVFEEWVNDAYGDVDIAGYSFGAGRALRELDEVAFREEFNNWIDSEVQEGVFREYVDSPVCEDCGGSLSQDDVTESLSIYDRLVCPSCAHDDNDDECEICGLWIGDCAGE